MSEYLDLGRRVLEAQPFSRLLGTELLALAPGRAELALTLREDLRQQYGFAHGGVLAYLADNALTFAGGTVLDGRILTLEMKINYLRPGLGDRLIARAEAISAGRSQAVCRCDIVAVEDGAEKLVAAAQGTIARAPEREGTL